MTGSRRVGTSSTQGRKWSNPLTEDGRKLVTWENVPSILDHPETVTHAG